MQLQIFAVYDSKAGAFNQPFFMHNKETAMRAFTSACMDTNTDLHRYPTDFALFHIGTYEDSNATIVSFVTPENLGLASQFILEVTENGNGN